MRHTWAAILERVVNFIDLDKINSTDAPKTFHQLVSIWKKEHVGNLGANTKRRYLFATKSLTFFSTYSIRDITSEVVDQWIANAASVNKTQLSSLKYDLRILRSIFNFYKSRYDSSFISPIQKRHYQNPILTSPSVITPKDLTLAEFNSFIAALSKDPYSWFLVPLAHIQYYHALRISEACAIHWEDIYFNKSRPHSSFLRIQRSLKWLPKAGIILELGFKNSKALNGAKDLPLFPVTHQVLSDLYAKLVKKHKAPTGLVFHDGNHKPLSYRQVQYAYDKAFKKADLPYRGTHILRHGGCRRVYRKIRNLETARQLLGNTTIQNTVIYAEAKGEALMAAARKEWKEKPPKVVIGKIRQREAIGKPRSHASTIR